MGCAWADIVLTAPEAGLPLLFIEADNCTEETPIIAAKFDKYMRHFHRKAKDTDGQDKPMWRTRWSAPIPSGATLKGSRHRSTRARCSPWH
ncbi:hypothetical protein OG585_37540 [Streptomyces sp. NBC_01340]|uniref:hypothetical protein n=1 Tax=unclassified Streptomyces TaxID=2593676 RepID=UPI00225BB81E|nr:MULTISPECIES: hypothetical protein [unclassified Streptomyces]MCX4458234.1 hypothetical protein [Streptomyces sp. NBC_01719]MCX4497591.1 hypothetical protein [Streptomyces sp. NBC_01728]WSI42417.1 hypothetical protein OG585_37540 [Streptomyces sp. NBC_01340]